VCGSVLPCHPLFLPHDVPCPHCGAYLWCCQRLHDEAVVLDALSRPSPSPEEIEQLGTTLVASGSGRPIVFNLSELETVTSTFLARLIALSKRLRSAGSRLILCEATPVVSAVLHRFRLDSLFEIVEREAEALALQRMNSRGIDP
jgi:anti-anti-sigma regulatory factor